MAAVTICNDFGAPQNKVCRCFHVSPSVCYEVMGPDAMILVFWMLSFKPSDVCQFSSFQFSHSVVSDSLWPHGLQQARPACPLPIPGVYQNSCPLSLCCHPNISASAVPFSSRLHSYPASVMSMEACKRLSQYMIPATLSRFSVLI